MSLVLRSLVSPSLWITPVKISASGLMYVTGVTVTGVTFHNPRYLFNTVAKLTKNKASTGVDISQQHSSNDFMNYLLPKLILLEIKL